MNQLRPKRSNARWICAGALRTALTVFETSWGLAFSIPVLLVAISTAAAQTTEFSYQGRLHDGASPANGNYDFEFKLFDTQTVGTGTQQGATVAATNVTVTAGLFTVQLDFGAAAFPGAARFLEIAVRPTGGASFTVLSPRQPVTSTPYTVRSIVAGVADTATNATQLGGLTASGFVQNTTSVQAGTSFNIGGTGTANILNAVTQFNLNGQRILSNVGFGNLFVGRGAGAVNTGAANAFFGNSAGANNTSGNGNAFFGNSAGASNTSGGGNAFFGSLAGEENTTGGANSFFGDGAGRLNTTGSANSFFGSDSGQSNTTGFHNAFFGHESGLRNTAGERNSFFGTYAGRENTMGNRNAFFGEFAGNLNTTGFSNAFFGASAGSHNATACCNAFFGTAAGQNNTTGENNTFAGVVAGLGNTTGGANSFFGRGAGGENATGSFITAVGANANVGANDLSFATAIGAFAVVSTSNTVVLGRSADTVQIPGGLNIAGSFSSNILSAVTEFRLNGSRALSAPGTDNLFAGKSAGVSNTGSENAFFGAGAGAINIFGIQNSFFGARAGFCCNRGDGNSFFGYSAGSNNIGSNNAFFGDVAGALNSMGGLNAFFGSSAGSQNTSGNGNVFVGRAAGANNTTGSDNVFIGRGAGNPSTSTQVTNSVAIGTNATVSASNRIALGTSAHTTVANGRLVVGTGSGILLGAGYMETFFTTSQLQGIFTPNLVLGNAINNPPSSFPLCFQNQSLGTIGGIVITRCFSSLSSESNKTDVQPFSGGLNVIERLRPVSFKWKHDGTEAIGLNAEDVAEVAPSLVASDDKGETRNVKESSLTVLFINAFKEQQAQIKQQQQQIDALKKLVCADRPDAEVCK